MMKTRTFSGTKDAAVQPYEVAHRAIARKAAADSIVLLKNDQNLLPIGTDKPIALYGAGASHTIKGGTGSGDVNERYSISIAEGLELAGYQITTKDWIADYDQQFTSAREQWKASIWEKTDSHPQGMDAFFEMYATTPFYYPAGSLDIIKTEADIAIYVLSRVAGEGADRFEMKGDYYLSEEEAQLIRSICSLYPNVVLVLNTGGQVDLSFVDQYENIRTILQISQLGCEGGNGFADVLSGCITPSGKLVDTWAFQYEDYPNSATFSHNNGNVNQEYYKEGIYVGYRYFDTFEIPVRYGFGYGLSYSSFSMNTTGIRAIKPGEEVNAAGKGTDVIHSNQSVAPDICVSVSVKNIGAREGKETIQIYVSCPQEHMQKEYRRLVAFAKTPCLQSGEDVDMEINFHMFDLASFSEVSSGWLLEKGTYGIFAGNSLASSTLIGTIEITEDQLLVKTEHICPIKESLEELKGPAESIQNRRSAWLSQATSASLPCIKLDTEDFSSETIIYGKSEEQIPEKVKSFVDSLSLNQLIQLATGDPGKGQGEALGSAGISVPGSAAQTNACAREQGLSDIVLADGPAGLRLNKSYLVKDGQIIPKPFEASVEGGFLLRDTNKPEGEEYYQYCTAFPVGTALAQTWDPDIVSDVGVAVGEEMQRFLVTSWLAPGMNIHRNPLCGRNFEYYSEDPLVAGKIAAAMTHGVQSQKGCGTTIKHFACNNQEDNRLQSDSIISERALREIYLKGFEIAVRESQPMMIMTSYNKINGVHSANNYDLCTKVARDEWGFRGFIMTDWTTTHYGPDCTAAGCMRAGNDVVMPGRIEDHENIRQELEAGTLTLEELKSCICHLVNIIWQSNMYE